MSTCKVIGVRTVLLAVTVLAGGGVPSASADPVVYFNLSYITGQATISQSGTQIADDTFSSGQTLPNTGTWAIADGVAVSQLGASAASSASLDINISPNLFSGTGRSSSSAATNDPSGDIVGEAFSVALFGVLFQVAEPTAYDYAARFVGAGFTEGCCGPSIR